MTGPSKSALVTGANGFIGRVLCKGLQDNGYHVTALLRSDKPGPWNKSVILDLSSDPADSLDLSGMDTVFHLAATASSDRSGAISDMDRAVNIEGTKKILEACMASGVQKLVYFSTVKAMGEGGEACMDESSECHPQTSYGRSKLEAERLLLDQDAIPVCILRLPMVYGSSSEGNLVSMIRAVMKKRFPPLPETHNRRSMIHVLDAASAAIIASEEAPREHRLYLLTDGNPYSTRQIYDWIYQVISKQPPSWNIPIVMLKVLASIGNGVSRLTDKPFPFTSDSLQKLIGSACYSNAAICRETSFRPRRGLRDALPGIISGMAS